MFIGTWVVVGLVVGFLASRFVIRTDDGLLGHLALGVAGAVAGGFVFRMLTTSEASGLSFPGFLMSLAGAAAALFVHQRYIARPPAPKRVRRAGVR
jgi:uncharacterized membrane protein YeaQ/YmgE (transglycosylase-associated protein family)